MEILAANLMDLGALRHLEHVCFGNDAWPLLDLIAVLTWPEMIRLKAVEAGEMIGFIAGDPRQAREAVWIAIVAVDPRFRRRGIGSALMLECERRAQLPLVKLTVRISNQPAISLYEKLGYHTSDIWRAYYSDGEDGLVMSKSL